MYVYTYIPKYRNTDRVLKKKYLNIGIEIFGPNLLSLSRGNKFQIRISYPFQKPRVKWIFWAQVYLECKIMSVLWVPSLELLGIYSVHLLAVCSVVCSPPRVGAAVLPWLPSSEKEGREALALAPRRRGCGLARPSAPSWLHPAPRRSRLALGRLPAQRLSAVSSSSLLSPHCSLIYSFRIKSMY